MKTNRYLSLLLVILGNLLYTLSVKLFLLPANLISCGTTGLALVASHYLNIPMTGFILVFNMAMLAIGWMILGRKFAMTTILSSILYPTILELLNRLLGDVVVTENILLNVLFAGMGLTALKVITTIIAIGTSGLSLGYLYMIGETKKRRSRWIVLGFVCILLCLFVSLILNYPAPAIVK